MIEITHTSHTHLEYNAALAQAESARELCSIIRDYGHLAEDALRVAEDLTAAQFWKFSKGIQLERKRVFAGALWAKKFGVIAVPKQMLIVHKMSLKYGVPFGSIYLRMKKDGYFDK